MNFRWLVGLVVVSGAVGVALAQVPSPLGYSAPASAGPPYGLPGMVATPPALPMSWTLSVAEDGKLQVQTTDGMRAVVERMSIPVPGCETVEVIVKGKQLQLKSGVAGKAGDAVDCLEGSADRIVRGGLDGAIFQLEGNGKLVCARKGKRAEVVADRIAVNVATGRVEGELGLTVPTPAPPASCPLTPCVSYPAGTPGTLR